MSANAHYFKIGLFVIISVVLVVTGMILLGMGALFRPSIMMETYIDESVQGLDIGSPVYHRGVKIGSVEDIILVRNAYTEEDYFDTHDQAFIEKCERYVLVTAALTSDALVGRDKMELAANLDAEIEAGLRVRLASQGVTGIYYLEADYVDPNRHEPLKICWEPKHLYVPSTPSTIVYFTEQLDQLLQRLDKINVEGITDNLERTLSMLGTVIEEAPVDKISLQIEELITELRGTNHKVQAILGEARPVIADVSGAVNAAQRILENSEEPIGTILDQRLPDALTTVTDVTREWEKIAKELPGVINKLETMMDRVDNLVMNEEKDIDDIIENLRLVSENLKEITENARRYPSQILFGDPPTRKEPDKQ